MSNVVLEMHYRFRNTLFREIYKNSWLTKLSNGNKKKDKLWVVFCVHNDTDAFLETYTDNKIAILHKPDWFVSLIDVQHISTTICPNEEEYEFVLTLKTEVLRFSASTREQMLDWVRSLREKLCDLRIISLEENLYSRLPDKTSFSSTRDPSSPLPPTPSSSQHFSTSENIFNFESQSIQRISHSVPYQSTHYESLFQDLPGTSGTLTVQTPSPTLKTFREQQVYQLQKEMQHSSGVRLQLRRKDCISSIALGDAFNSVWVCGWKQKEHPLLYNALHIGDKIITINGDPVKSATEAHRVLVSQQCDNLYVNILIKRIPHGQVFVIHRETEGQQLGIIQNNNTAVIDNIESNSLAAKYGLTARAPTCDGLSLTNWVLTEINGRPLNLFFKKNQVRDRLNSVGRDISILVQPLDLIKQLKKQLKSLKNYKEYIIQ